MHAEQIYAGFKFSRAGIDREKRENLNLAKISRYSVTEMLHGEKLCRVI